MEYTDQIQLFIRINSLTRKQDRVQLQMDLVQKILNCKGEEFFRLKCNELFDPKQQNHGIQNAIIKQIQQKFVQQKDVFLFTLGQSGAGKTHSFFGSDVNQNEIKQTTSFFENLYKKLHKELIGYHFRIGFAEISYMDQKETFFDLLSTKTIVNRISQLELKNIQNEQEFQSLFLEAISRSENFVIKENSIRFNNNENHFIIKIQMYNDQNILNFTFCDLVGFSTAHDQTQNSLQDLIPFLSPEKTLGHTKLQQFFIDELRSSDSFCFFTPTESKNFEYLIEFAYKIQHYKYEFSKKQAITTRRQNNIKQQQSSQYRQEIDSDQNNEAWDQFQNINQSLQEDQQEDIQADQDYQPQSSVAKFWKKQQEDDEKPTSMSVKQEQQQQFQTHIKGIKEQIMDLNDRLNYSYDSVTDQNQSQSIVDQNQSQDFTKYQSNMSQSNTVKQPQILDKKPLMNKQEYLSSFDQDNSASFQIQQKLIFYFRNYDILMNLYNQSEQSRKKLSSENQMLKNDIQQIATQSDIRLQNEKIINLEQQKKIRFLQQESSVTEIHEFYEKQIEKLQKEKQYLISENNKILNEMSKSFESETDRESSLRNHILRRNDQLTKVIKNKEEEVDKLHQILNKVDKSQNFQESLNHKLIQLQKQYKDKIQTEKQLVQHNEELQSALEKNRHQYFEQRQQNEKLNKDYQNLQEQLLMFKQIADENVQLQRSQKELENTRKTQNQQSIRNKKKEIFQQLRSIVD